MTVAIGAAGAAVLAVGMLFLAGPFGTPAQAQNGEGERVALWDVPAIDRLPDDAFGRLVRYAAPADGPAESGAVVRNDSGVREGDEIS
ncbi:MAG: hypothetical protein B7Y71_01165, partial [Xanthobacter sp. 35-67-6]